MVYKIEFEGINVSIRINEGGAMEISNRIDNYMGICRR